MVGSLEPAGSIETASKHSIQTAVTRSDVHGTFIVLSTKSEAAYHGNRV